MKINVPGSGRLGCLSLFGLLSLFHIDSIAISRMEKVTVSEINGTPCFSVPSNSGAGAGLAFYSIMVSETRSVSFDDLPVQMWGSSVIPYGNSIIISSRECIRYGQILPSSRQRVLKELQPFKVYSVFIKAGSNDDGLMGYSARFCLTSRGDGPTRVVQLLDRNVPAQYNECRE